LLSFLVDLLFCSTSSSGWRIAFFLPSIFAILQSFGKSLLWAPPSRCHGIYDNDNVMNGYPYCK
jgi:hypothetical protein